MNFSQLEQRQESESIALEINKAGWRRGSVFLPNETIELTFSFNPDNELLMILTHSCTVVSSRFNVDPLIEVMPVRKLSEFKERSPEATGKNLRKLHVKLPTKDTNCVALECDYNRRMFFDRKKLLGLTPLHDFYIGTKGDKILATWMGRICLRAALPDELVVNMKPRLYHILEKVFKTDMGNNIENLFIQVQTLGQKDVNQDLFNLKFIFICISQESADELDKILIQELSNFLIYPGQDNIHIAHLHTATNSDTFIADLDGYERFSEWDHFTDQGELYPRLSQI